MRTLLVAVSFAWAGMPACVLGPASQPALPALTAPGSGTEPIVTSDLLRLATTGEIEVSRDGQFAVYTVRSIVAVPGSAPADQVADKLAPQGPARRAPGATQSGAADPDYTYRTHLWQVDLSRPQAKPMPLTRGQRGGNTPRISPDGHTLAFLRGDERGDEPATQVWLIPLDRPGEARQLTALAHPVTDIHWRPDGTSLLVTVETPATDIAGTPPWDHERPGRAWEQRPGSASAQTQQAAGQGDAAEPAPAHPDGNRASMRRWLARNAGRHNPSVLTRIDFQDELTLNKSLSFAHLWLVDTQSGKATHLAGGFRDHYQATFSPDGTRIAFVDTPRTAMHPDRQTRGAIYVMDANGANVRPFLDHADYTFDSPTFAKDGTTILVRVRETKDQMYRQAALARVQVDNGELELLSRAWSSRIDRFRLSSDGAIYAATQWHGAFPLKRFSPNGTVETTFFQHNAGVRRFAVGGGRVVAAVTTVDQPVVLVAIDKPGNGDANGSGSMRVLHDLNPWTADKALCHPEEHMVTRADGLQVQYWVMPPTGHKADARYPTVLEMHGGPSVMWGPGELTMWHEFQLLCSWGYGVVYANPRGSTGYGFEFQHKNHRDWGTGPAGDVLAALDDAIRTHAWIDPNRLLLTGGSYAGYLTAWIVGHDHRFKAAVAQRGVYDLSTFFGEGNAWRLVPWAFGGFPWDDETAGILARESPFSYVHQIQTPLLLMHASQDLRTGVSQSEMMYRALKQLGRPVEYVRYPGAGHDLSRTGKPHQRMDRLLRIIEFFERYADNQRPAPSVAKSRPNPQAL